MSLIVRAHNYSPEYGLRSPAISNMDQDSRSLFHRIGGRKGISTLLRHFYADVRQQRLIGSVFNERIKDWPAHLAKIGEFGARVTGGPSSYSGHMPAKHLSVGLVFGLFPLNAHRRMAAGASILIYEKHCLP